MNGLWNQILDNLSFLVICVLVIAALALLAKYTERFFPESGRSPRPGG